MTDQGRAGREERRAYWESAVELHRSSGLGVRDFCEREGLSPANFYAWRRKLGQNPGPARTLGNVG
jgi:hypothetical protein